MIGLCIFIGVAVVALGAVVASAFSQGAASTSAGGQAQATATNAKDKKSREDKTLIGLKSATLNPTTPGLPYALTNSFDATSFVDKCTLSFTNAGGVSTYLNDFSIRGLPIYRYAGNNGYKFEHINHSDVEANGEMAYKVSNNYITSAAQCEDVGDYVRKELEPHDMYSVTLNGVHPYYQIGDRYELNIDYQLASMPFPTELISVDVEIRGVMINRRCDNIGQTVLSCRVPSGAWNKTTSTKAKWISSGLPLDKLNRSNELTIGAYDYPGQADIYCDGVADDVQIQEAINYIEGLEGGGKITLTKGTFILASFIIISGNTTLTGWGKTTILYEKGINITGNGDVAVRDLVIDGNNVISTGIGVVAKANRIVSLSDIEVKNISASENVVFPPTNPYGGAFGIKGAYSSGGLYLINNIKCKNLYIHDITGTAGNANATGIYLGTGITGCIIDNVQANGTGDGYGLLECNSCMNNKATNCSTAPYYNSYADSSTGNACADTAAGGYNS